jgi:tetratricopeptide (TPR) repeat protein
LVHRTKGRRLIQSQICASVFTRLAPRNGLSRRLEFTKRLGIKLVVLVLLAFLFPIAMHSGPLAGSYALATAEFDSGKLEQASKTLERALSQNPENATLQLLLARCYYDLNNFDRAAAHAEAAEKLEPQNAETHLWLGRIYGRIADKEHSLTLAVRTRKEFEKAVSLDPSNLAARKDLMEFYLDAPWLLGGGKNKAKKQAEAIATLNPAEGASARAQLAEKNGDISEAAKDFQKATESKSNTVNPYLDAADFFQSSHDVAGMKAALAAARKVNPGDPRLYYYQAVVYIMEGSKLDEAERDLKTYLTTAQRSSAAFRASALSYLGDLYERFGKPRLASEQFHAALQLEPDYSAAQQGLDRLEGQNQK